MNQESKIINLVPAAGWKAIYEDHGRRMSLPLVAWALVEVEEGGSSRSITGLVLRDGVPTPANRRADFKGYEQSQEGSSARSRREYSTRPATRVKDESTKQPCEEEEGASLWFA